MLENLYFCKMLKIELHNRIIENKDWATILFIVCFLFVIITKSAFENKFSDFKNLFFSDRYAKMYKDKTHLMTFFTFFLFIVQVLSLSFFIHYILYYFGWSEKADWIVFIQIVTGLTFVILSKYLIEKIISTAFNVEDISEQYNMLKVSYRNYIALLLLPITIILFYNSKPELVVIQVIIGIIVFANLIVLQKGIKIFQKLIISKLFYFILYLCTLEIAPYYFMYYWFTER